MSIPKEVKFTYAHLDFLERQFPERTDLKSTEELFTQQGVRRVIQFIRERVHRDERRVQTRELSAK
jgi:hypothetical protein